MEVTFWGTRGSIAKAGPSTLRYGGNTSCVEVRTESGTLIVIDCGTGAHGLGAHLVAQSDGAPVNGHVLISHTHWDHIQGLPFFAPLFRPDDTWHVYGPRGLGGSLSETLSGQMQYSYFPVSLDQLAAQVHYHDLVEGAFEIDDISITTQYLNHPALTLGYRLEADGASVVYACDHEPHRADLAAGGELATSRHDRAHLRFLADADLVIHDTQYLADEFEGKTGWGHSTMEYVVDAAEQAGVRQVALSHHDPARSDAEIDVIVEAARVRAEGSDLDVFAAAEGSTIELTGSRTASARSQTSAATLPPALDEMPRSVLIAVRSPDIAAVLREAAEAESIEIFEEADPATALEIARTEQPAIIVLEDDDDSDLSGAIRGLDGTYGSDVNIVKITASNARQQNDRWSITDWLLWPFSSVYVRTKLRASLLRRACRWQNAPLPADEDQRVERLRALEVLDTPHESRFDRYTQEVSELLDMPVALVSLVDTDRQWFKSAHGIDLTETPRDMSFCAHAILDNEVLQVPDAMDDGRFAENPAVAGDPRVRFYAGAPLELSDGSTVGTLCVIDYRPRLLTQTQLDELRRLAGLVATELETPS